MNFRPMVFVERTWTDNGVVFATRAEAEANARDLMARWYAVTDTRADETDAPVNYSYATGKLIAVEDQVDG